MYKRQLIDRIEQLQRIRYAPLQREAISAALRSNALVLTGGPGTGKTTAVNAMLAAFEQCGDRVALAAPTAVSYTHLDVYKRQVLYSSLGTDSLRTTFAILNLSEAFIL